MIEFRDLEKKPVARKEIIHKELILETSFIMARQERVENVTARRLDAKIGCSTQPIFRLYTGKNELYEELYQKANDFYQMFSNNRTEENDVPFVKLGLTYILFAMQEKQLFQLLFLSEHRREKSFYELLNGNESIVSKEIIRAQKKTTKDASEIFMKMWIFIHGIASMVITNDYDLSLEETQKLLEESFIAFTK